MKKTVAYLVALMVCAAGVAGVGGSLLAMQAPDCPSISTDEIAMGRSGLGFPQRDLARRDDRPDCIEGSFEGRLAFRDRDLTPEDVVEMAAAAGWTTEAETLDGSTCFIRGNEGWERLELVMENTGEPVTTLSIGFNPAGACTRRA